MNNQSTAVKINSVATKLRCKFAPAALIARTAVRREPACHPVSPTRNFLGRAGRAGFTNPTSVIGYTSVIDANSPGGYTSFMGSNISVSFACVSRHISGTVRSCIRALARAHGLACAGAVGYLQRACLVPWLSSSGMMPPAWSVPKVSMFFFHVFLPCYFSGSI